MIREHSTSTRDAAEGSNSPFFDLTICPSYNSAYKNEVLIYHGLNKTAYRSLGFYYNNDKSHSDEPRSIFNSATYNINELLNSLNVVTRDRKVPRLTLKFNEPNTSNILDITTKYWYLLGRCYSFHLKDIVLKLGIIRFEFVSRMGIFIYFGYPGQFMHPNTKTKV